MIKYGVLDMNTRRVIWLSVFIMNGPHVVRKDLPEDFKEELTNHNFELTVRDRKCFEEITMGESQCFIKVKHENYENVVKIRRMIRSLRRNR